MSGRVSKNAHLQDRWNVDIPEEDRREGQEIIERLLSEPDPPQTLEEHLCEVSAAIMRKRIVRCQLEAREEFARSKNIIHSQIQDKLHALEDSGKYKQETLKRIHREYTAKIQPIFEKRQKDIRELRDGAIEAIRADHDYRASLIRSFCRNQSRG